MHLLNLEDEIMNQQEHNGIIDFWVIAVIDYDKDQLHVMYQSPDCRNYDIFINGLLGDDNGIEMIWLKPNMPAGVYRLQLKPWSHQDYQGEWDRGVDVVGYELLYAYPEIKEE